MAFSEFQYSNKKDISAGETWTVEQEVASIDLTDKLSQGRQLTLTVSNPLGAAAARYSAFQRVRLLDRPSNALIFLGRIVNISNNHRRQTLTIHCSDYFADLASKSISTANLRGNRRSDIVKDILSGGTEPGKTLGVSGYPYRISDSSKKFNAKYVGKIVKVPSIGPSLVTAVSGHTISDSKVTFDASFVNRLIRKVDFTGGRKVIQWEGRVTALASSPVGLTVNNVGIDARDSGGADYRSVASGFVADSSYWEIVGYEGKIERVLSPTTIDVATVASGTSIEYTGHKSANFSQWGPASAAKGGVEYFIESAEEGVYQATSGNGHSGDKSIDADSRVDDSPYMEYVRRSYGQGQSSAEGARETIQALARDEVWEVPQSAFFAGHLDSSLGVSTDKWMLTTAEANTGVDLIYKPVMASLPLQHRVTYQDNNLFYHVRAVTDPAGSNPKRVFLRKHDNSNMFSNTINVAGSPASGFGFWDNLDGTKNRIQIGNEERKVTLASNGSPAYVDVDKPFNKAYASTDDVVVGIGPHVGCPKWDDAGSQSQTGFDTVSPVGYPNLIKGSTMFNAAIGAWTVVDSSLNAISTSDFDLELTLPSSPLGGIGYITQSVAVGNGDNELTAGKRYLFSVEVARRTSAQGDDAADRLVKIGTDQANWTGSAWQANDYNSLVNASSIVGNTIGRSNSPSLGSLRRGWVQYNYEFIAPNSGAVHIHLGIQGTQAEVAVFDSIQLRRVAYDSRLYIGSPRIFSGFKLDLDTSANAFHSMDIEFWGRHYSTGKFGWWNLGSYSLYVMGSNTQMLNDSIFDPDGTDASTVVTRGIDHFNRSGTVKWGDIGLALGDPDGRSHPNRDWNHWAKKDLRGSEPLIGSPINDLDNTVHNNSGTGGNAVTELTDPALSNLYWIRISVPRDEAYAPPFTNQSPGFVKNIKILDGRAGWTDATDIPSQYDSTERTLPKATWDFRMDDPQFFTAVGKVDSSASTHVWTDYTKALTSRSKTDIMGGFSTSFRNTNKYFFFGADYKFTGIEFNLAVNGSSITPHFDYWNGIMWVSIEDLNAYRFTGSGSARWDMEAISSVESSGTDYSSYFSEDKWVKRDLRAASNSWGGYNYNGTSGTANLYKEPTLRTSSPSSNDGTPINGDDSGVDYPGGVGNLNALNTPHHHLYWIRMTLPSAGTITTTASISTVRMFSKPAFKYFERGTEPWNFNITGTDAVDSSDYGKHELSDDNGQFLRSPSTGGVWVKNTSAADLNQSAANILSASKLGLQPALRRGGRTTNSLTDTTGQTTELSNRAFLSAGLFLHGFTPTNYQGRAGSNYLLYQDKRVGLKSYESYGGGTSSTHNWHGARFAQRIPQRNQDIPLYRYEVREIPIDMVTRVTVNGQDPVTFTSIDTELEDTYSVKQEKIIYDRTITSVAEAETSAESILSTLKPLTTQTIKKVTLEIYDYPVFKYNSASTATTDRTIPRVIRAGDVIKLTINDGNYVFTNEPFLVQGITYDDKKSLAKLDCTQGLYPASPDTSNIWAKNFELAKLAKDSAQQASVPSGMPLASGQTQADIESQIVVDTEEEHNAENATYIERNTNPSDATYNSLTPEHQATASGEEGFDGKFKTTIALHHNQGAITLGGDTQDVSLTAYTGSGLNLLVLNPTSSFVARDGGFTPMNNWTGRTIYTSAHSTTCMIEEVINNATVRTSGGVTWANNDSLVIRKISSALESRKLGGDFSTIYYDTNQGQLRARTTSQVRNPTDIAAPFWGTVMTGFHGTKLCNTSGEVVIDLLSDHSFGSYLTHKPMVIATVDPTDVTGNTHATTSAAASFVVVKKFTAGSSTNVNAAQWGDAGAGSSGSTLVAQAGNNTVSTFTAGSVGAKVYMLDGTTLEVLDQGVVQSITNPYTMETTMTGWVHTLVKYYVEARIRQIYLQVYKPAFYLGPAASVGSSGAVDTVLVNPSTSALYSSDGGNIQDVMAASAGTLQIGVSYQIIPRPSADNGLPFTGTTTTHAGHNV